MGSPPIPCLFEVVKKSSQEVRIDGVEMRRLSLSCLSLDPDFHAFLLSLPLPFSVLYSLQLYLTFSLTRDTFSGLNRLETLELLDLDRVDRFDSDVLSNLMNLKRLSVETYPNIGK